MQGKMAAPMMKRIANVAPQYSGFRQPKQLQISYSQLSRARLTPRNARSSLKKQILLGSAGIVSIYVAVKIRESFSSRSTSVNQYYSGDEVSTAVQRSMLSRFKVNAATVDTSNTSAVDVKSPSTPWHLHNAPTKQVKNGRDLSFKITLYQYVTCPFCCKVRAYLDYHGINYDIVEVDSIRRTQKKWTKYGKVPIVVCDGVGPKGYLQMNDSSVIVSLLDSHRVTTDKTKLETLKSYYPSIEHKEGRKTIYDFPNRYFIMFGDSPADRAMAELKEEREWRQWVDDNLVHTLSPNAYRTLPEALESSHKTSPHGKAVKDSLSGGQKFVFNFHSFRWFSEVGDWENCMSSWSRLVCIYSGALVMWAIGGRLKRKYGLESDVRLSLYKSINDFLEAIGPSRKFMGGDKPNLADISVYGVMCSIEGCQTFKDLCDNTDFMKWYAPMKAAVLEHHGLSKYMAMSARG